MLKNGSQNRKASAACPAIPWRGVPSFPLRERPRRTARTYAGTLRSHATPSPEPKPWPVLASRHDLTRVQGILVRLGGDFCPPSGKDSFPAYQLGKPRRTDFNMFTLLVISGLRKTVSIRPVSIIRTIGNQSLMRLRFVSLNNGRKIGYGLSLHRFL